MSENEMKKDGIEEILSEPEPAEERFYPLPYDVDDNCIALGRMVNNVWVTTKLCNFLAWVDAEIIRDDGIEQKRSLRIVGTKHDGTPLPPVTVTADDFGKMDWMRNGWPTDCNIFVLSQAERHVQVAIRHTAERAAKEQIFTVTGWHRINGQWEYLLPGGDHTVELSGKQRSYCFECGAEEKDYAIGVGLTELDFIPPEILQTCLAAVFLSPLNEFLRQAECEPKFLLTLVGHTGCKKSTLAALLCSFFGKFSATDLPMTFRDTANSITYNSYSLKDVLTCIDDYHPAAQRESANMKATMQMVCRAYGDRAARNGLTSSYTLREARPPQGNAIITAEHIPDVGESAVARLFCVNIPQNCMDMVLLSEVQEVASQGRFRRIMYGYVHWLRDTYLTDDNRTESFVSELRLAFLSLRDKFWSEMSERKIRFHARTADAAACLSIGYRMMLKFYRAVGMINNAEKEAEKYDRFHEILLTLSAAQSANTENDRPTHIYIRKLMSLLENGECTVMDKESREELPKSFVGYEDEKYYYLSLEKTHKEVNRLCLLQGEEFPITTRELGQALREDGYIDPFGTHSSQSQYLGGRNYRCIRLKKSAVAE